MFSREAQGVVVLRALSLLVLLGSVAPSVAPLTHRDDHQHRYCAEHETLEEVELGIATSAAPQRSEGPGLSSAAAERSDHTPCASSQLSTRTPVLLLTRVDALSVRPAAEASAPLSLRSGRSPVRLLILAPKASPPLV